MKLRVSISLFLAIILFFTSTAPVFASPNQQNPDDAIREALNATAQELGISARAQTINEAGVTGWALNPPMDPGKTSIFVLNTDALFKVWLGLAGIIDGSATQVSFYGFTAYRIASILFIHNINGYYVTISDSGETLAGAMRVAEVFFRHAAASGFIDGNGSGKTPPGDSGTVIPELTVTPETGARISLRAYGENYSQATESLDNSGNFASVDISGRVTDADTGAAIEGAVVEITSGAAAGSTVSAADGSYSLTAGVSGGEGSGSIQGIDFSLSMNAELIIEVTPGRSELLADGTSTSSITIQVKDLQGNPLKDRVFSLEAASDAGPGTIQPDQAATDENGLIQTTYTAFKLEPGQRSNSPRHEVTITARDTATGLVGTNWIFVNQYQLSVQYGEYILACTQCTFPSEFSILVSDYWNNPIPNTPLTLRIEGGSSGGTLAADPNSNTSQQEITLSTDSSGRAAAYYKWQGSPDITEAVQKVVILEGVTNAQVTKDIKVQGIDISLARVEEAGFTGVTGQQAFLKVYFKELAHPDLPLDRFNTNSPNKLGLRVTISQYHSDGVNTSLTYENYGEWEQDARGLFVKMYDTPHMPYIIPVNDGSSWYEIRVDPVTDHNKDLPDLFRANNDTILVLKTGSPDGWLHIWLQDGILTPHNWAGVVFKCVGRFLPGVSQAMTVVDTLNQTYKMDVLDLGQSTAQVLTEALENKSTLLASTKNVLDMTKTAALNNIISCMQDIYSVSKEGSSQGSTGSSGGRVCAVVPRQLSEIFPLTALNEDEAEMISIYQDRFAQGLLLDAPDEQGIVVYGLEAGNVTLRDASGAVFDDPERMSVGGFVAAYILPVDETFDMEVVSDHDFEIGIYQAGSNDSTRTTIRHVVQADTGLTASMAIGSTSDYSLEIVYDDESAADQTLKAQPAAVDVVKPQIISLHPEQNVAVTEKEVSITASYTDNPDGIGIDRQAIKIFVDGIDLTFSANVQSDFLSLALSDIGDGEHTIRLVVSDLDGNAAVSERAFTIQDEDSAPAATFNQLYISGAGIILFLLLGTVIAISFRRKQGRRELQHQQQRIQSLNKDGTVQDQQGNWWYQDPDTGTWNLWDGETWQASQTGPEIPPPPPSQALPVKSKGKGCLTSIIIVGIMIVLIIGGFTLVAFGFIPPLAIQPASTVSINELLKIGGGGLVLALAGTLLLHSGFKSITSSPAIGADEFGQRREKSGCLAKLNSLVLISLGLIVLIAGLGLIALALYQQLIPLLGYSLV